MSEKTARQPVRIPPAAGSFYLKGCKQIRKYDNLLQALQIQWIPSKEA